MAATAPQPFAPDVVQAVCRHMNDDHRDDALLICRTLGSLPEARSATAVDVDAVSMRFRVTAGDEQTDVQVPFVRPISQRAQIRTAVVELYERACQQAGLPSRVEHAR